MAQQLQMKLSTLRRPPLQPRQLHLDALCPWSVVPMGAVINVTQAGRTSGNPGVGDHVAKRVDVNMVKNVSLEHCLRRWWTVPNMVGLLSTTRVSGRAI